ncbi:YraN family protein [Sphingobacterium sp. LRF_L2]|uniref:YraN family protein n=1 Tax=Sphingobacterium sp. LRF_L2 TaxID=3369421 RepID=UPI003F5F56B0
MAKHLEDGKKGEQLALDFLKRQGYDIITINWRFKHLEVDIIAKEDGILVFVEVKARRSVLYGEPDSFVDWKKQRFLLSAAQAYLSFSGYEGEIRFDIVSVYLGKDFRIELIKDAFWSN